jgi:threonine dehydratase
LATETVPTLSDIEAARERIRGIAELTPVFGTENLSRLCGRTIRLKAENLQRTGSFKIRGAVNKLATLTEEERAAGVVAASAGNHAQAVAWSARAFGVRATIFMPAETPNAKIEATRNYGAEIVLGGESFDDALASSIAHADETGATFVHAFDDEYVIAGQGTVGLELAEQVDDLETVVVPIGGGGLAAGIALALREVAPRARVVGVQAAACAPFTGSTEHGFTIAEGIAVKRPGELTRAILGETVDEIVTVTDEEISQAIVLLLERAKLTVEGAGAAAAAALLGGKVSGEGPAVAVVSGGNIDATTLIQVMRHGLTQAGRYLVLRTLIPDRPGELVKLLELFAEQRANVVSVEHHREGMDISVSQTEVEATLGTRDLEHCARIVEAVRARGYEVERVS